MIDVDFLKGYCVGGHDWAIVELVNPIKFNENIRPICLPSPDVEIEKNLMVVGWGKYSCKFLPNL